MPKYPTPGQKKLISNYCDIIKTQIVTITHDDAVNVNDKGELIPNNKYLEMESNSDVQNLISLLKYTKDDLESTVKNINNGDSNSEMSVSSDDLENKLGRLKEYFVLPDFDNVVEDIIKH